jgi:hypothetical protein
MGSSGFENWTKAKVDEHNARVAGRNMGRSAASDAITTAHLATNPEAKVAIFNRGLPLVEVFRRESTDVSKLNKTERAFFEYLSADKQHDFVWVQAFTLKLADDTRYTPDFVTLTSGKLIAWEVKGFFRDDAKVKIKVAARMFSVFQFKLVRKGKGGWDFEDVKP